MSNFCRPEQGKEVLFLSNEFGIHKHFIRVYKICQNSASNNFCKPEKRKEKLFLSNRRIEFGVSD